MESEFFRRLTKDREIRIDNSMFTNWDSCFVKGLLSDPLKKQLARSMDALVFGGAVHAGLDSFYRGGSVKEQIESALEQVEESGQQLSSEHPRTEENLRNLFVQHHVEQEQLADIVPISIDGEPVIEKSFSMPLGTIEISTDDAMKVYFDTDEDSVEIAVYWEGRIDMLATFRDNLWLVDHKTTTVMGEKFVDDKLRSSQFLGYYWAGCKLLKEAEGPLTTSTEKEFYSTDTKIEGVLVNAIALRKKGFEFKRFEIPFSPWKVEEWVTETLSSLSATVYHLFNYLENGEAVPTREHCVTKYGRCPFFDFCEAHPNMRTRMLDTAGLFQDSSWSPLN